MCHEIVGGDSQARLPGIMIQQFPIEKMVRFVEKHIEAADATLSNMMRKTRTDDPSHSKALLFLRASS